MFVENVSDSDTSEIQDYGNEQGEEEEENVVRDTMSEQYSENEEDFKADVKSTLNNIEAADDEVELEHTEMKIPSNTCDC